MSEMMYRLHSLWRRKLWKEPFSYSIEKYEVYINGVYFNSFHVTFHVHAERLFYQRRFCSFTQTLVKAADAPKSPQIL